MGHAYEFCTIHSLLATAGNKKLNTDAPMSRIIE